MKKHDKWLAWVPIIGIPAAFRVMAANQLDYRWAFWNSIAHNAINAVLIVILALFL